MFHNFYININNIDIIFITSLVITISNILIKLDPNLYNLTYKIIIKVEYYNNFLVLLTSRLFNIKIFGIILVLTISFIMVYYRFNLLNRNNFNIILTINKII